jgi:hypothetical protein
METLGLLRCLQELTAASDDDLNQSGLHSAILFP